MDTVSSRCNFLLQQTVHLWETGIKVFNLGPKEFIWKFLDFFQTHIHVEIKLWFLLWKLSLPAQTEACVYVCVCECVSLLDLLTLFGAFLYFFECAYADLPMVYWRHSKGPQQPEIEQTSLNFYPGWYIFCAAHRVLGAWSSRKRRHLAVETALGIYLLENVFSAHFRPLTLMQLLSWS